MFFIVGLIFLNKISLFFQLNVLHTELAKQLADTMILPIIQFREKDLTGKVAEFGASYLQNINSFHNCSDCINFFKSVHH